MADPDTKHGADDDHGHDADHGEPSPAEPLGPVDVTRWAYALAGSALGLLVVLALYAAQAT